MLDIVLDGHTLFYLFTLNFAATFMLKRRELVGTGRVWDILVFS